MTLVKIETGSRIPPPEGPFRISFLGHISATDQDIFMKFGGYVGNALPQGVECSKHVLFESPIWQTSAIHHSCNVSAFREGISASDQNIFIFGGYVDNGLPKCVEWSKYDSFENPIWRTAAMHHIYNISVVNFNVVN